MAKPMPKILLIFNLDQVLYRKSSGVADSLRQTMTPNTIEIKPGIKDLSHFLFIRNRVYIKVGVWSLTSPESTENLSKKVFSDYYHHLLFKYSSNPNEIDLQRVWLNYPEYNHTNTGFPEYQNDDSLMLFQEYLRFFSLQFGENRIGDLEKFIERVKFTEYYGEKNKKSGPRPQGEASRFW